MHSRHPTPARPRPRRSEVLRRVVAELDRRAVDGGQDLLPATRHVDGAREAFADDADLLAALLLRWHARLSVEVDRGLATEPRDLPGVVARAWAGAAAAMPGTRLLLDQQHESPVDDAVAQLLRRARHLELARMALAAGLRTRPDEAAVALGAELEEAARGGGPAPTVRRAPRARRTAGKAAPAAPRPSAGEAAPRPLPAATRLSRRLRALLDA